MSHPENPLDLVHQPSTELHYPDWVDAVADRAVWRVSGLKEFVNLARTFDLSGKNGFVNGERIAKAKERFVKIGWDKHVPITRNERNLKTQTSQNHFKKYIKNSQGSRICTSLYNACIITLMAEEYLSEHGVKMDIYEGNGAEYPHGIKFVPHVFNLDADKGDELYTRFRDRGAAIRQAAGQTGAGVFSDACKEDRFLFSEQLMAALHDGTGQTGGVVYALANHKEPSPHERTVYPLSAYVNLDG